MENEHITSKGFNTKGIDICLWISDKPDIFSKSIDGKTIYQSFYCILNDQQSMLELHDEQNDHIHLPVIRSTYKYVGSCSCKSIDNSFIILKVESIEINTKYCIFLHRYLVIKSTNNYEKAKSLLHWVENLWFDNRCA